MCALDYKFFNPNPRGKIVGDCVKRAIVVATGKDYKDVELEMNRTKKVKSEPYNSKVNYVNYLENVLGLKPIKMTIKPCNKRWHVSTIDDVMKDFPKMSYIMCVSKHLIGVKNRTIYDLGDDRIRDKGIYKIWLVNATPNEWRTIQFLLGDGDDR